MDTDRAPFRVGAVPGVIVSTWTRTWAERYPDRPLEVIRTDEADQSDALRAGRLDMCFVRAPLDREGLSAIPLYTEVSVVVVPPEHPLAALDEVSAVDLEDEDLLQVPEIRSAADAVALVAAGAGLLVLPMSVARLYRRRDVTSRPVRDLDGTDVLLAWVTEHTTDDVEDFIGVVRGRTPRSSRGRAGAGAPGGSQASGGKPRRRGR